MKAELLKEKYLIILDNYPYVCLTNYGYQHCIATEGIVLFDLISEDVIPWMLNPDEQVTFLRELSTKEFKYAQ